jgi:hypothetical protein
MASARERQEASGIPGRAAAASSPCLPHSPGRARYARRFAVSLTAFPRNLRGASAISGERRQARAIARPFPAAYSMSGVGGPPGLRARRMPRAGAPETSKPAKAGKTALSNHATPRSRSSPAKAGCPGAAGTRPNCARSLPKVSGAVRASSMPSAVSQEAAAPVKRRPPPRARCSRRAAIVGPSPRRGTWSGSPWWHQTTGNRSSGASRPAGSRNFPSLARRNVGAPAAAAISRATSSSMRRRSTAPSEKSAPKPGPEEPSGGAGAPPRTAAMRRAMGITSPSYPLSPRFSSPSRESGPVPVDPVLKRGMPAECDPAGTLNGRSPGAARGSSPRRAR